MSDRFKLDIILKGITFCEKKYLLKIFKALAKKFYNSRIDSSAQNTDRSSNQKINEV